MPITRIASAGALLTLFSISLSAANVCWDKSYCMNFTMKNPDNGLYDGNDICAAQYVQPVRGMQPPAVMFVNAVDAN